MKKEVLTKNTALAASAAVISIVAMTIAGELNLAFKNSLAATFSHHWIGKSVVSIIVFAASLVLFYFIKPKIHLPSAIWILTILISISSFILFLFFLLETLL
jgi:hypothetical protein